MNFRKIGLGLLSLMVCLGMASLARADAFGQARIVNLGGKKVAIAADVPGAHAKLLSADLARLPTLEFQSFDPEMLRVMGLEQARASDLTRWLADRMSYVLSARTDTTRIAVVLRTNASYPYRDETPVLERVLSQKLSIEDFTRAMSIMTNIGTGAYYLGKVQGVIQGLRIEGVGTVAITSPRVGVFQLGEGIFSEDLALLRGAKRDSETAFGLRLSTYFHEARHGDGHGKTLGFFHARCPSGHTYAYANACDRNLNGPYTVGAYIAKGLAENCPRCAPEEREALKLMAADGFDRVIRFTPVATSSHAGRRAQLMTLINTCGMLKGFKPGSPAQAQEMFSDTCSAEKVADYRRELAELTPSPTSGIPSTDWDAEPESVSESAID